MNLSTRINKDALSERLKKLGATGAKKLRDFQLQFNAEFLEKSKLEQITEQDFLGSIQQIKVYQHAAYTSNMDLDAYKLHNKYIERATNETWIEQVKSQLMA